MSRDEELEQKIKDKGLIAPRVTLDDVNKAINQKVLFHQTVENHDIVIGIVEMNNGFCVVGNPIITKRTKSIAITLRGDAILEYKAQSGSILRFGVILRDNGRCVVGSPSASISAENDNRVIGERLARENCIDNDVMKNYIYPLKDNEVEPDVIASKAIESAVSKVWSYMGFALADKLSK